MDKKVSKPAIQFLRHNTHAQDSSTPRTRGEKHAVVIAVAPDEKDSRQIKQMVAGAGLLAEDASGILPVSVLSPIDLGWPIKAVDELQMKLTGGVKQRLDRVLNRISAKSKRTEVVFSPSLSVTRSVKELCEFVEDQKADAVVLTSQMGKKMVPLTGLGSFTERLICLSKVPVMVIGRNSQVPNKILRIVFPTDFSAASRKVFEKVTALAKKYQASLEIVHHSGPPVVPYYGEGYYGIVNPAWIEEFEDSERHRLEKKGDRWVRMAAEEGVLSHFTLDQRPGSLGERLVRIIRQKNADLMVVGIHRRPLTQIFLGRAVRTLFSKASCPVLVVK